MMLSDAKSEVRVRLFLVLYAVLMLTTMCFMYAAGERRLDAYFCMYTLEYLVLLYTVAPEIVRSRLPVRVLTMMLVLITFTLIGWRVYRILAS